MILQAAFQLSEKIGYTNVTRDEVAKCAKISSPLIASYFPRMIDLKKAIIQTAIEREILAILAQGLVLRDPLLRSMKPVLRKKVLAYLSKN